MRQNRIYITGILLLFAFLSGRAQQPRIDELECRNLKIGYEKTLHMIFPTPVKYLNACASMIGMDVTVTAVDRTTDNTRFHVFHFGRCDFFDFFIIQLSFFYY